MSLGFNWVDRMRSFWKILTRLHGTNLCINSTISARFASTFVQERNNPKCTQILQNAPIHELRFKMRGIGCVNCEKFRCDFKAQTCALIAPLQPVLHRVSSINETLPNAPKHYETHQNMGLGINWVDRVRSFWKILMRLHGTNLCINFTILACFASSFVQ